MTEKIAYEKHPVSPERKAELRAKGYKIIDARFDPDPKPESPVDAVEALKAAGVKFDARQKKPAAADVLTAFERSGLTGEQWNNLDPKDQAARIEA